MCWNNWPTTALSARKAFTPARWVSKFCPSRSAEYSSRFKVQSRDSDILMNIHEYQAKQLLAQYGVAVPAGEVCTTPEAAKAIAEKLFAKGEKVVVVKSQIHAGGRGKGTFKSGFQGGVKLCKTAGDVFEKAKAMLGQVLVTKQTGPEGRLVSKLLVAAAP